MKITVRLAALAAALVALPAIAQDANSKLVIIEGSVMLNTGEQYADAVVDAATKEGDRVMAMEGARAVIRFDDGCDLEVEAGTIVTVPEKSPCAGAVVSVEKAVSSSGSVAGGAGKGLLRPAVLIPAAIVGACLAIDGNDDKTNCKDDPASP